MVSPICISNYKEDPIKGNLEHQWPLGVTFEISISNFLKTKLNYNNSKNFQNGVVCCILIGILRVPNVVRSLKFASLQNNILRLTEANKQVKRDEVAPKATGAISGAILSLCLGFLMVRLHLLHYLLPSLLCCVCLHYALSCQISFL